MMVSKLIERCTGHITGLGLLDYDTNSFKIEALDSIINKLKQGYVIDNLVYYNNKLIGTNGHLDRYSTITANENNTLLIVGDTKYVIIKEIVRNGETTEYELSNGLGTISIMDKDTAIKYANENKIANGMLMESKYGRKYIRPIKGKYIKDNVEKYKNYAKLQVLFDKVTYIKNDVVIVQRNGKKGLVSLHGKFSISPEYDSIALPIREGRFIWVYGQRL